MKVPRTIAFGPKVDIPSWEWVGFDIARELSKYFTIILFEPDSGPIPQSDLVVFIKHKPHSEIWLNAKHRGIKMIYCPVDNYKNSRDIHRSRMFLRQCEAILVHCERLLPAFKSYCRRVEFVEHHNRFGLRQMTDYKQDGYVVWVGFYHNLGPTIQWLQVHPLGMEIRFVTNFKTQAQRILPINDEYKLLEWSPQAQYDQMSGAKAAFDIKGLSFNQINKPPVKAQQFISSGIPFATNGESYSAEYFDARGLQIPTPNDKHRWLSREYWGQTQTVGSELRKRLTLENVGLHYQRIVNEILHIA